MKELKLRGLGIFDKKWIYGDGIHYPKSMNYKGRCFIDGMKERANDWIEVIPETVGQFTGLCDKNGKEIYSGDIIEFYLFGEEKNLKETGYICYSERRAAFMIKVKSGEKLLLALNIPTSISILDPDPNFEVIGNITDNTELI